MDNKTYSKLMVYLAKATNYKFTIRSDEGELEIHPFNSQYCHIVVEFDGTVEMIRKGGGDPGLYDRVSRITRQVAAILAKVK